MSADQSVENDPWFLENLVCPVDGTPLRYADRNLVSLAGRKYPVINGIPVMLVADTAQTHWVLEASRKKALALTAEGNDPYCLDTIGISDDKVGQLQRVITTANHNNKCPIDPVVSFLVGATNGIAYRHLIEKLQDYPIPKLRLSPGAGKILLDVGCNWGRWCIAAARNRYRPVGIDPSLGSVLAAQRVAKQLGVESRYIVGDARALPFKSGSIDVGFSYSVFQHFSREDATKAVREIGRVLRPGGMSLIQMPTVLGVRCLYHQLRRGFRDGAGFDVRYWRISALRRLFTEAVGPSSLTVDCYFGIGLQSSDLRLMPFHLKMIVLGSETLRRLSNVVRPMVYLADSVYVTSLKYG